MHCANPDDKAAGFHPLTKRLTCARIKIALGSLKAGDVVGSISGEVATRLGNITSVE